MTLKIQNKHLREGVPVVLGLRGGLAEGCCFVVCLVCFFFISGGTVSLKNYTRGNN